MVDRRNIFRSHQQELLHRPLDLDPTACGLFAQNVSLGNQSAGSRSEGCEGCDRFSPSSLLR